jgi:DNA-binding XRE family transcriptional regulator
VINHRVYKNDKEDNMKDGATSPAKFQEWRKRLGYTQGDAAEKLTVTRATVQNWESGTTPIPPWLPMFCERLERRWKQINPAYGSVALLYCDGPMTQPVWGPARVPTMRREPWPTMGDAIRRACQLTGSEQYHSGLIVDEEGTIWGSSELAMECQRLKNKHQAGRRANDEAEHNAEAEEDRRSEADNRPQPHFSISLRGGGASGQSTPIPKRKAKAKFTMSARARRLCQTLLNHHRARTKTRPPGKQVSPGSYTISYSDLCLTAGVPNEPANNRCYGEIADWCLDNEWPPLNSLAVNKDTRQPGDGYDGSGDFCDLMEWPTQVEACIRFNGYPRNAP